MPDNVSRWFRPEWAGPLNTKLKHLLIDRLDQAAGPPPTPEVAAARTALLAFAKYVQPDYEVNWHHRVIAESIEAWCRGEITRLIVMAPSQTGKSRLSSILGPAWLFGINPNAKVILGAHTHLWAASLNRDIQRIIDSEAYHEVFPRSQLWGANVRTQARGTWLRNSDAFEIVGHRGKLISLGVGGGVGQPCSHIVLDDPYREGDAKSESRRQRVWEWWINSLRQRATKGRVPIMIVMTPWHEDDIVGRLIRFSKEDPRADKWTILRFPMVAEAGDMEVYDHRKPGELLWPTWKTPEYVANMQATTPVYVWNTMFQMRPVAPEGTLFKTTDFRYYRALTVHNQTDLDLEDGLHTRNGDTQETPGAIEEWFVLEEFVKGEAVRTRRYRASDCAFFQTCDLAQTLSVTASFSVVVTFALTPDSDLLVYDVWRRRLEDPQVYAAVQAARARHPRCVASYVETKSAGLGVFQQARAEGRPMIELKAWGSKEQRAGLASARYNAHKVFHLQGAPWLGAWEKEISGFPGSQFDDQADCLAYGSQVATYDELVRSAAKIRGDVILSPSLADMKAREDDARSTVTVGGHRILIQDPVDDWVTRGFGSF